MVQKFGFLSLLLVLMTAFACSPKYPKCDTDDHCKSNDKGVEDNKLFCVNGLCQQCKQDVDCGDPSLECNAGACDAIPGYCTGVNDCPGNQKCMNNRCAPECVDDSECGSGKCAAGACVEEKKQCAGDADCPDGEICKEGVCSSKSTSSCSLEVVRFEYDASGIRSSDKSTLQANADCIKSGSLSVRIEGHADETGSNEYNMSLGEKRARAVYKYLRQLGVPKASMTTITYGEEKPACTSGSNCDNENRRVEFQLR